MKKIQYKGYEFLANNNIEIQSGIEDIDKYIEKLSIADQFVKDKSDSGLIVMEEIIDE